MSSSIPDWIKERVPKQERSAIESCDMPDWLDPMLAVLWDEAFSDPDWIYERKLDGERCLVYRHGSQVTLLSRNEKCLDDTYPELVEALDGQEGKWIGDGEIVAFDGDVTSFRKLQQRLGIKDPDEARATGIDVFLYLFDILWIDGCDVRQLPLRTRKRLLKDKLDWSDPVRYTEHRNESGEEFLKDACKRGWEGLIAKLAEGPYRSSRSKDWRKLKCIARQEFVVVGFTEPGGDRPGFGALLLGYYDGDDLVGAGKVGTGFDHELLNELHDRLQRLERKTSPLDREERVDGGVHWVTPKLVCEVAFTEWTDDGKLRHPRFVGLRDDKKAKDVVRERPREN